MSAVQYPILRGQSATVSRFAPPGGVPVSAGGSWLFDPLNRSSYNPLTNPALPVIDIDRADPAQAFAIERIYLPFVYSCQQGSSAAVPAGIPPDSYNVIVRGNVGPTVAFTWTASLSPLYNVLTAAASVAQWALVDTVDTSPGFVMQRSQRLSISFRLTAGSSCYFSVLGLYLSAQPAITGYPNGASFTPPDIQVEQGFVQLAPAA